MFQKYILPESTYQAWKQNWEVLGILKTFSVAVTAWSKFVWFGVEQACLAFVFDYYCEYDISDRLYRQVTINSDDWLTQAWQRPRPVEQVSRGYSSL